MSFIFTVGHLFVRLMLTVAPLALLSVYSVVFPQHYYYVFFFFSQNHHMNLMVQETHSGTSIKIHILIYD